MAESRSKTGQKIESNGSSLMNDDAQEAALGLLGLTNNNLHQLIPQKRKLHPHTASSSRAPIPLSPTTPTTTTVTTTTTTALATLPLDHDDDDDTTSAESIRCICGYTHDDGWSVACDRCGRWYHGACVEIEPGAVPQFWICPEHSAAAERDPAVDQARKERAQAIQRQYQRKTALANEHNHGSNNNNRSLKRRPSPGTLSDKKQRRISSGEVKRRRRSISKPVPPLLATSAAPAQQGPSAAATAAATTDEDEHVEIDVEDTFVPISQDAISLKETREKLSRNAQHWRGVTALDVTEDTVVDRETYVKPTPHSSSSISPSFALHTSSPVKANQFISPYTSTIVPSSVYLSDPLNAYAHLGMPKPFVHLIGPPHNIALDSRIRGNTARFARSGCHPNSVLRPYLCGDKIAFGIFALRDLKENEEVVLGWEWDDGNAIHHLPAVLEHPELFTQEQQQYLRFQLANLLHSLGSTFATCACGSDSKQCALKRVNDFIDGVVPEGSAAGAKVNMGPLVGIKRGFHTKERVPRSSGMFGVEMVNDNQNGGKNSADEEDKDQGLRDVVMEEGENVPPVSSPSPADELRFIGIDLQFARTSSPAVLAQAPDIKGKGKAVGVPLSNEESLPPRMRKRWNKQRREALAVVAVSTPTPEMDVETEPEPEPIQVDSSPLSQPPLAPLQQQHPQSQSQSQSVQIEPKPPPQNQIHTPHTRTTTMSAPAPPPVSIPTSTPAPAPAPVTPAPRKQKAIPPSHLPLPPPPMLVQPPTPRLHPTPTTAAMTPQTPLSLPPQTQAAISSLLTLSNQYPYPPTHQHQHLQFPAQAHPSPSAQFANLSLYSPALVGRGPTPAPALGEGIGGVQDSPSPFVSAARTTHDSHVRFATSPPVVHPISSPPPSSSHDIDVGVDRDEDAEMKSGSEVEVIPPSPSPPLSPSLPSAPIPHPRSPSRPHPHPRSGHTTSAPSSVSTIIAVLAASDKVLNDNHENEPLSARSASRSQSPHLSPYPKFENEIEDGNRNGSMSPSTTPSPLQSTLQVPTKDKDMDKGKERLKGKGKGKENEKEKEIETEMDRRHTSPPPSSSPLPASDTSLPTNATITTITTTVLTNGVGRAHQEEEQDVQGHGNEREMEVVEKDKDKEDKETPPPLAPQPKVKMSLRDFAMRRKKQREEQAATEHVVPSPPPQSVEETTPSRTAAAEKVEEKKEVVAPPIQQKKEPEPEPQLPRTKRRDVDAEVLKQAHINRSTLSFGSFGIDDDFIMNSEDSKLDGECSAASSPEIALPNYGKSIDVILDTPRSPSPGSSPLSVSAHLPTPSPQPEPEPEPEQLVEQQPQPDLLQLEQTDKKESQEEEGEITASSDPTPPPPPAVLEEHNVNAAHIPLSSSTPSSMSPGLVPVKNPPTQPRSFLMTTSPVTAAAITNVSISPPPHLPSRRPPPLPLPPSLPLPNRPPPMSRPPSGPRAFRQSFGNGIAPPRGPLADRDRDRDRDSWDRERERGVSWSSRGRGRGSWVR